MASGLVRDPKLASLIDEKWMKSILPYDDLEIPSDLLPDEEQDEDQKECATDLEKRWTETNIEQILRFERTV